jgi:hypothetical protein
MPCNQELTSDSDDAIPSFSDISLSRQSSLHGEMSDQIRLEHVRPHCRHSHFHPHPLSDIDASKLLKQGLEFSVLGIRSPRGT